MYIIYISPPAGFGRLNFNLGPSDSESTTASAGLVLGHQGRVKHFLLVPARGSGRRRLPLVALRLTQAAP